MALILGFTWSVGILDVAAVLVQEPSRVGLNLPKRLLKYGRSLKATWLS